VHLCDFVCPGNILHYLAHFSATTFYKDNSIILSSTIIFLTLPVLPCVLVLICSVRYSNGSNSHRARIDFFASETKNAMHYSPQLKHRAAVIDPCVPPALELSHRICKISWNHFGLWSWLGAWIPGQLRFYPCYSRWLQKCVRTLRNDVLVCRVKRIKLSQYILERFVQYGSFWRGSIGWRCCLTDSAEQMANNL